MLNRRDGTLSEMTCNICPANGARYSHARQAVISHLLQGNGLVGCQHPQYVLHTAPSSWYHYSNPLPQRQSRSLMPWSACQFHVIYQ